MKPGGNGIPCDSLREPFHRTGYCINCRVLAVLHTEAGWRRYYLGYAEQCDRQADGHRARGLELERAAARYQEIAAAFPTPIPANSG